MIFPLIVSFLSGISTLLGTFIIYIKKYIDENKIIGTSLAFSSGIMISVSLFDLIPNSILGLNTKYHLLFSTLISIFYIFMGCIFLLLIKGSFFNSKKYNDNNLYKTGLFSMIGIILHNIPEGIATFFTTVSNRSLGISFAFAVAMHNIPEGISISVPIYYSTRSKNKAFLYTFISGFSELVGALIAIWFLKELSINIELFINILYSFIAGIMLCISFYELIPTSFLYENKIKCIIFLFFGFIFMGVVHFII